ncbi:MAG: type II CRISPR-associated endonuclease Cas1 [Bryobacterales bacterium]|nr:type II CRISPR-associated endonuclease Cas1 [Bryobacterales bacterium]
MTNRVLDFAEHPARLSAREGLLRIEVEGASEVRIPFSHLAALVCSHGQVSFTQSVLAELAAAKATLVVCDRKHLPVAMMLPLVGHGEQTNRFQRQAAAGAALQNRLWGEIVAAKIRAQANALLTVTGEEHGFAAMARRVGVRNATAAEAHASRVYWPRLFGDGTYRRGSEVDARNALLDYGYAVVRAIVARALCGAGLHTGLGVHHHNKYDPYPLANDLMEPLRPRVDEWVAGWCAGRPAAQWRLDRASKGALLDRITGRFSDGAEARTLFDWAGLWSERLARCLEAKRARLEIEEVSFVRDDPAALARSEEDAQRVQGDVAADDV